MISGFTSWRGAWGLGGAPGKGSEGGWGMDRMDQEFEQKVTEITETALRGSAQSKRNGQAGSLTSLTGTARCGAACRVVWEGWQAQSCHPDPIRLLVSFLSVTCRVIGFRCQRIKGNGNTAVVTSSQLIHECVRNSPEVVLCEFTPLGFDVID